MHCWSLKARFKKLSIHSGISRIKKFFEFYEPSYSKVEKRASWPGLSPRNFWILAHSSTVLSCFLFITYFWICGHGAATVGQTYLCLFWALSITRFELFPIRRRKKLREYRMIDFGQIAWSRFARFGLTSHSYSAFALLRTRFRRFWLCCSQITETFLEAFEYFCLKKFYKKRLWI